MVYDVGEEVEEVGVEEEEEEDGVERGEEDGVETGEGGEGSVNLCKTRM